MRLGAGKVVRMQLRHGGAQYPLTGVTILVIHPSGMTEIRM